LGHGLFTYYLIEGLRGKAAKDNGEIEVKELFKYVRDRIKKYIDYWNSPERFQIRQDNLAKGIVIKPSRTQTPQQILRGSEDIVLGKAVTAANRKALVIKTLAVSETAVNLCQILQGKGGFEVDYYFPEDKEETELERAIALYLQSASKTVLLYLAGKIAETDKSVYQLWLSNSAYITLNWLKQQLDESPIAEKIIVIDCFGTNKLDRCFNLLKPSTERSQSMIAASVEGSNQTEFITQLVTVLQTAADSQAEFWVAELITQLQKNCRSNPEITLKSWLSGATEVLELLLPQTERKLVKFDANYCPYKGLLAFRKEDANFFYGRDALIQEIVSQLKNTSFLAVVGASGSGKSSVVQAGVLPQLETKGLYSDRTQQLQRCQTWVMRPGSNPIAALINSIAPNNREFLESLIHSGVDAFGFWLQQQPQPMSVLVIDQFEELFTLTAESDRSLFLQFILAVCDKARDCFKVIITLRDDFMKECLNLPELGEKIQQSHILVRSYFTEEQYRQIITQPARQVGITVEEELVKVLLEEVQTGSLPLLQFALAELWRVRTPGSLTLQDYQQYIGGIAQILEEKADLTYKSLTEAQQKCAQLIFLSLVQLGEGKEDTRRRMTRSQLLVSKYDKDKASRQLFQSTLQALIDARLIVVSLEENDSSQNNLNNTEKTPSASCPLPSASSNSEITVEVIHEILIRNWQTLRWWLDKNRDRLRLMREIEQQAQQWSQNQQNKDYLLRGTALARAEELYIKYADELSYSSSKFIGECIQERDRIIAQKELEAKIAKRRRRLTIGGLIFGLITVSGFAGAAIWQLRQATINEINALSNSAEAQLALNQELDALVTGLKAGRKIKDNKLGVDTKTKIKAIGALQNIFYRVKEFNRLEGHVLLVRGIAFSPNGQMIASAIGASISDGGIIKLWNRDGQLLHTLTGHSKGIQNIAFSPDGQMIASASRDGIIKLWNLDGQLLHTLNGYEDEEIPGLIFSPDGQMIASASKDGIIKLWNLDGQLLHTLKQESMTNSITFSPDGKIFASASFDGIIKLWNRDGQLLHTLKGHKSSVEKIIFHPDGQIIASASNDETIKLWNREGELLHTLTGHTDEVLNIIFSPDGQTLLSSSRDTTIKLWYFQKQLLRTLNSHTERINHVAFSPDGQMIASAGWDNKTKLWDKEGELLHTLTGHTDSINEIAFNPNGQIIASVSGDKTVKLWNKSGTLLHTLTGHKTSVSKVIFNPDGQMIASASNDGTIKVWNKNGKLLYTLTGHKDYISEIVFSPDGKILASASFDGTIKLWSWQGKLLYTLKENRGYITQIVFSPDGQTIASASQFGTVKLWNLHGELLRTLEAHKSFVNTVVFSPDGQTIASANEGGIIKLWNKDGQLLHILNGHTKYFYKVVFSSNSQILASASDDGTVKLWNLDGDLLNTLKGHTRPIMDIAFSPDGTTIASASNDGTVKLWSLDLDDVLTRGCDWARDYLINNPNVSEEDRKLCDDIQ
jgi:WD40 repeat protein/energy-coupling factor transporter ATP-binding protein EcfA2